MSLRGSLLLLVAAVALVLASSLPASAQLYNDVVTNSRGQPIAGSSYTVCSTSTVGGTCASPATLYTDSTLSVPCTGTNQTSSITYASASACSNPILSDPLGRVTFFTNVGIYYTLVSSYQSFPYSGLIQVPGAGGGGGGVTPCGFTNDVQLYLSTVALGCDSLVLYQDTTTHTLHNTIYSATQEMDVTGTSAGEIDLGAATLGSSVAAATVAIAAPSTSATGVRYILPGAVPTDGYDLYAASHSGTDVTLGFHAASGGGACELLGSAAGDLCYFNGANWARLAGNASGTKWLQETSAGVPSWTSLTGAVSYEKMIPLWTTGCDSPTTCTDLISTAIPWGQSMFYGGPPLGTDHLPFVLTPTTAHDDTGSSSTISITYSSPIEPGDTIILQLNGVGASAFCNIQDAQGDVFNTISFGNYYVKNAIGGTTTITAEIRNLSCGGALHAAVWQAMVSPIHGADHTNPIDATSGGTTGCTGNSVNFDAITTSNPAVIIPLVSGSGMFANGYSSYTAGAGYTMGGQIKYGPSGGISGSRSLAIANGPFSTPGTYTPTMTADNNCSTDTISIAVKPASATSADIPMPRVVKVDDVFPNTHSIQPSSSDGDTQVDLHVGTPINADGVTTTYSAAVLFSTPATSNTSLVVEISVDCKTATATLVPSFSYTDVDSDVVTVTFGTVTCGTTSSYTSASLPIRALAGTNVTFTTGSLTNSPHYNVHALVKQVSTN